MKPVFLTDVIREVGGWPVNISAVGDVLNKAHEILPGGCECIKPLNDEQIRELTDGKIERA